MASVRASVVNQARMAASRMSVHGGGVDGGAVEQLLRCARLSPNPAHTLEWALDSLRAHPVGGADHLACELLQAARARLQAAPARTVRDEAPSLAWA